MQDTDVKKIRKSVRLEDAYVAKLKTWVEKFHTKEEAAEAFVGTTGMYTRALQRLLGKGSAREDVVNRAKEIIAEMSSKKTK